MRSATLIFNLPTILAVVCTFSLSTCRREEIFPSLGSTLASPTDVVADKTGKYFFVLNSDYPRDYNMGSIVTLSSEGEKVGVNEVPRLGRSLTVAGDDLVATFSSQGDEGPGLVRLYDVSDPLSPKMTREWTMESRCNPINAVMSSGYKYFAVSCSSGALMVGELKTPRSESTLVLVRNYPGARRAMHLDVSRNLLLAFPTDLGAQNWFDMIEEDSKSFDDKTEVETAAANEIPDKWETYRSDRRNKDRRGLYQFTVYNFATEAASGFPYKENVDVQSELRWVYFNLDNFDGSPDIQVTTENITKNYYRTNFWAAKPDQTDSNVFYLSHRGYSTTNISGSPHANSVIRVRVVGDLTDATLRTDKVLRFERIYGFKGELDASGRHYPGAFDIQTVRGQQLLLVNHFRDLVNFPNQAYYSLAAKVIGNNNWFTERGATDAGHSYFQLALTSSGRGMAVSFYGNVVILLDAFPGTAITEVKTIN